MQLLIISPDNFVAGDAGDCGFDLHTTVCLSVWLSVGYLKNSNWIGYELNETSVGIDLKELGEGVRCRNV